jgi:hypothetical protein
LAKIARCYIPLLRGRGISSGCKGPPFYAAGGLSHLND